MLSFAAFLFFSPYPLDSRPRSHVSLWILLSPFPPYALRVGYFLSASLIFFIVFSRVFLSNAPPCKEVPCFQFFDFRFLMNGPVPRRSSFRVKLTP